MSQDPWVWGSGGTHGQGPKCPRLLGKQGQPMASEGDITFIVGNQFQQSRVISKWRRCVGDGSAGSDSPMSIKDFFFSSEFSFFWCIHSSKKIVLWIYQYNWTWVNYFGLALKHFSCKLVSTYERGGGGEKHQSFISWSCAFQFLFFEKYETLGIKNIYVFHL